MQFTEFSVILCSDTIMTEASAGFSMVIILHQSVLMFSNNSLKADIQYIYLQCQPQLTISSYGIPIRCNVAYLTV